jgi:bla regulator protein BlaR1
MASLVSILLGNALAATLLAVLAAAIGRVCRRPAVTHSLWLIVLLKLITPPLVPVSLPAASAILPARSSAEISGDDRDLRAAANRAPSPALTTDEFAPADSDTPYGDAPIVLAETAADLAEPAEAAQSIDLSRVERHAAFVFLSGWNWEQPLLVAILAGALGWWALATVRIIQFQRLLRAVRPVPGDWQAHTDKLADQVGLGRRPAVCLVPGRVPPMLWAIGGRPRLLVPSELWAVMGEDERTSLLLHELAHLKRRDHWVRWLELIVAGLYWWHPVVWWARRALRDAEEQCCDAWVVWAMPRGARTYAAALLAAVEFVSGARTAPAAASATSGSGHVSCLKRRLKMILHAKTPKGLSWAGRIAVLGMATLILPLAPSWAQNDETTPAKLNRLAAVDKPSRPAEIQLAFEEDQAVLAAKNQLSELAAQHEGLRNPKHDQLLALLTKDDDKPKDAKDKDAKDDDDLKEKARDAAEHFQEQLTDLIGKLGKQFGPVTEEIRKALDRAVGEVHKSLDKQDLSVEDLGKALEKSQDELRKAFEGGGPVDKELREAIEKSRNELQGALDRGKAEVQDQVESLRERSRDLADQAKDNLERAKDAAEKATRGGDDQPEREELEVARKEIRDLEQQLRSATRKLDELQRRGTRRNVPPRRERNSRAAARPEPSSAPDAKPAQPAREPAAPAMPARPARPEIRRPQMPGRPGPGGGRRGQEGNNGRRIEELEQKMKNLLKELENLKDEKPAVETRERGPSDVRPIT